MRAPILLRTVLPGLALAFSNAAAAPVSHVFLIQNSGWMEPFYSDPASQYKALVTELVLAVTQADDAMVLAAFNQSVPGAPSPKALLTLRVDPGSQRARVAGALASLTTATKPGNAAFADTDLSEAVNAAIKLALAGKPGLIWLFTNNKNSPNNDLATERRNREFYELIHQGADIKKALAFPLRMPVEGKLYSANGLMVYVLAIHEQGVLQLDALLRSGRLQRVISEPPARLKPLDRDTVSLKPVRVIDVPGVAFSMAPGILRADVQAGSTAPTAKIFWALENVSYPYTIVSAQLTARSRLADEDKPVALGRTSVTALTPGNSVALASVMALPVARLHGKWSLPALRAAGSVYVLPGNIEIQLSAQKLALSPTFRQRMLELFPGDPLPDIFTPPAQILGSRAVLPIEVRVHFGIAPLLTLIGVALALLALLGAALFARTRPRKVQLTVEAEVRTLITRAGKIYPIYDRAGKQIAELNSTLFGHRLVNVSPGAQVHFTK